MSIIICSRWHNVLRAKSHIQQAASRSGSKWVRQQVGRYLRILAAETKGTLLTMLFAESEGTTSALISQSCLMATAVNDPHTTPLQGGSRSIDDFIGSLPQKYHLIGQGCCAALSRRDSRQGVRIPWCRNSGGQPTCSRPNFPDVFGGVA